MARIRSGRSDLRSCQAPNRVGQGWLPARQNAAAGASSVSIVIAPSRTCGPPRCTASRAISAARNASLRTGRNGCRRSGVGRLLTLRPTVSVLPMSRTEKRVNRGSQCCRGVGDDSRGPIGAASRASAEDLPAGHAAARGSRQLLWTPRNRGCAAVARHSHQRCVGGAPIAA